MDNEFKSLGFKTHKGKRGKTILTYEQGTTEIRVYQRTIVNRQDPSDIKRQYTVCVMKLSPSKRKIENWKVSKSLPLLEAVDIVKTEIVKACK